MAFVPEQDAEFVTWNPVTGCTKASAGCAHCCAERIALRLKEQGQRRYRNGFRVTLHPESLREPLHWRKPRMVLTCSMADIFHDSVPVAYLQRVFAVMERACQHAFMVLSKRSGRMADLAPSLLGAGPDVPANVWMGVSVESEATVRRLDDLRSVDAAVRFVCMEPLLGPVPALDLSGIDWVIVGGETGPGARIMDPAWARDIRDQCVDAGVRFMFKQWGGAIKGSTLDGRTWCDMPPMPRAEQLTLFTG